jgi:P-type Cu2+ transporter
MAECCYHCGLPIPAGVLLHANVAGQARAMCCIGCQAVSETIVANGFADYYSRRDQRPAASREAMPPALFESGVFDHPSIQKDFVREVNQWEREAALIVEGLTCPACVWLIEQYVARIDGVRSVRINLTTHRMQVRWDTRTAVLSKVMDAVVAVGYRAYPDDRQSMDALVRRERQNMLWRLFVAGFGMMQVMMYAIPVYLANGDMTADIEALMRWAGLVLTLPVMLYSAAPFFKGAWRDLGLRRVGMDVPVALGIGVAFLASAWATVNGTSGAVYFDSITMFVFLLLGGRYLEMSARQRAARGVEALNYAQPSLAFKLDNREGLDGHQIAVAELSPGDCLLVRPGEAVPADGQVISGVSTVDEALITGESRGVTKQAGDSVIGGSTNGGSPLIVEVTACGEASCLAMVQRLVAEAAHERPRIALLADRISGRFLGVLLALAVASALYWWHLSPERAFWVFVSVLVVSCPCALSLATPTALVVAAGALARRGVYVTKGSALEALASANFFVFDKTGTLTEGHPQMLESWFAEGTSADLELALAAALEAGSEHPLAQALTVAARASDTLSIKCSEWRSVTGAGVEAHLNGMPVRLGKLSFAQALHGKETPGVLNDWLERGDTVAALADAQGWRAGFRFGDRLRSDAFELVERLRRLNVHMAIFSGDDRSVVRSVGAALSINDARGNLWPQDKRAAVCELQTAGYRVAMVGDGVNDAPVLAQAHVSIAMGTGTRLAQNQADIVLLGGNLGALADAQHLARRTMSIIRQNLMWAFGYNAIFIPLAMADQISPLLAGVGMSASSLIVVLNALRLQRAGKGERTVPVLSLSATYSLEARQ